MALPWQPATHLVASRNSLRIPIQRLPLTLDLLYDMYRWSQIRDPIPNVFYLNKNIVVNYVSPRTGWSQAAIMVASQAPSLSSWARYKAKPELGVSLDLVMQVAGQLDPSRCALERPTQEDDVGDDPSTEDEAEGDIPAPRPTDPVRHIARCLALWLVHGSPSDREQSVASESDEAVSWRWCVTRGWRRAVRTRTTSLRGVVGYTKFILSEFIFSGVGSPATPKSSSDFKVETNLTPNATTA